MRRRDLMRQGIAACACGCAGSTQGQTLPLVVPNFTWDYYDPSNILIQETAYLAEMSLDGLLPNSNLPLLPIAQLNNIDWYATQDIPSLMMMQIDQVPGLETELTNLGYTIPCVTTRYGCDYTLTTLGQVEGLNWDYLYKFPSVLNLTLGELPSLAGLTFAMMPGLGTLPFSQIFQSLTGIPLPLFVGLFPSMVEVVARRVQRGDAAIFAIDRGHPWHTGEYRYLNSNMRVKLDTITTEVPGTATFHLEILICPFPGICFWSPPLPWPTAYEQSYALYIPPGINNFIPVYPPPVVYNPNRNIPANPGNNPLDPGDCSGCYGVAMQAYATAISQIEGGYASVGIWIARYRTRPLGRYQYLGSRSDVRAVILQNPGGAAFLAKVDSGVRPSGQEVLKNFTPAQQDSLFRTDTCNNLKIASGQIDPTTGQPFTGDRLIERAAQIHFSGPSRARIDWGRSDDLGRLSVYGYGKTALANYKRALAKLSCSRT
ncbi:hypothetical protein [Candidatus Cyanaurora vandensis]|uniref:hypothetical protein n=1 Tax=Candidatus Cyanaurora vandensis TaxID=2714958 RepID=UPI00258070CE|nr:hypothetical protein [Candidatus Cyanaurora vandensis]